MAYTRTYTVYFSDEELATLEDAIKALDKSYREREPHIDSETSEAIRARLELLAWTLATLKEKVWS